MLTIYVILSLIWFVIIVALVVKLFGLCKQVDIISQQLAGEPAQNVKVGDASS